VGWASGPTAANEAEVTSESAILSWSFDPLPTAGIVLTAVIYLRGWLRLSRQVPERFPTERLLSFLAGLGAVFLALCSPLDAFAGWLLIVHMVQHLLLTMVAPPLLLLGFPMLPMLLGLPRALVRDGIGPFLSHPPLHRIGRFLVHPFFAGPLFMISNLAWHAPGLYELALQSPGWHRLEHLCFLATALLFWWPVVQPWPSRPALPRWVMIPYLLAADLQNTALAAFLSFYEGILYPTYAAAPRISDLSALEDQAGAGAVMWVPGSVVFLVPVGVIALRYLSPQRARRPSPRTAFHPLPPRAPFDLLRTPLLGTILRHKLFRPALQGLMFSLAALIVLDGLFGPQVSAMNLAGVLPWTHWRGLTVAALLVAGNLFCMACPLTLARDLGRKIFPAARDWPRPLRSKWLAVGLLAGFFWAYEFFDLWDSPWWTAWIIVFYFVAAIVVDGIFRKASFCKYLCPIGQFHFVSSLTSPLEVRVREPEICGSCRTHDCIRGNPIQRGCELDLFQPRKSGNMDCTFCMDCIQACPHDNVGILVAPPGRDLIEDPRRSSIGSFSGRLDIAALVLVFVFAAFAIAAGMIAPVREWEEIIRQTVGARAGALAWSGAFVLAVLVLPAVLALACGCDLGRRKQERVPGSNVFRGACPARVFHVGRTLQLSPGFRRMDALAGISADGPRCRMGGRHSRVERSRTGI
jgi:cytochrome c oxidase assembly factor CtaG/ferredoxin